MACIRQLLVGAFGLCVTGFLLDDSQNATRATPPSHDTYHDLAQLLMEEKTLRLQLEGRLNTLSLQMTRMEAGFTVALNDKDQTLNSMAQRVQMQERQITQLEDKLASINATLEQNGQTYFFSVWFPVTDTPGKFRNEFLNIGDAYNTSTGVFTCKRAGVYFFTLTLMVNTPSLVRSHCYLYLNGRNTFSAAAQSNTTYESGTNSAFLHLTLNDSVTLSCGGWDLVHYYTSFSGGLITAD